MSDLKTHFERMDDYMEWRAIAQYASGKADNCASILNRFEERLPEDLKEWLYTERASRRDEASRAYDKSIEALKGSN